MDGLPEAGRSARRILILKPSSLGDVVHALPLLAALRRARPDAHVSWLAATAFAPLLEGHPLIDEVIRFDRARLARAWRSAPAAAELAGLLSRIRRARFDLVLDLQGLFRSGWMSWVSGAPVRVGFADGREFAPIFLTHRISCDSVVHAVDRNLRVAHGLGWPAAPVEFPLGLREPEVEAARVLLRGVGVGMPSDGEFVAVLPGARWRSKLWRPERWAALLDRLALEGRTAVVLGGPGDTGVLREIEAHVRRPVASLAGRTTLRELTAVLSLAGQVICTDSGPMHLAAALRRPVVAVFGPTDPRRCGPYSPTDVVGTAAGARGMRSVGARLSEAVPIAEGAGAERAADGVAEGYSLVEEAQRDGRRTAVLQQRVEGTALRVVSGRVPCARCYRRECWHQSCMQRVTAGDVLEAVRATAEAG
ncbi:MAG: glycosyltransferase family 9 protein [Planctomycetia bacterium]|nr:MAG: glycosyltransferase family 9 protein [Planctomycetia bacterium]